MGKDHIYGQSSLTAGATSSSHFFLLLHNVHSSLRWRTTWRMKTLQETLQIHLHNRVAMLMTCTEDERGSILPNFPKPTTPVLQTPRLDDDVKEQPKKKGKDPHFGQEKVLFKLQYLLLDVSGPLMCLWSDLTNPDAEVASEQILLLIQHALVLLSSTSHVMILERRKIT